MDWNTLHNKLRQSPCAVAMVMSGGGCNAIGRCFSQAGASRTFVEAVVPYSRASMHDYLGSAPAGPSASLPTAKQLASVAYHRCRKLSDDRKIDAWYGLALVAALPTDPPRSHQDQIHVCVNGKGLQTAWSENLERGKHTRDEAESICERMILEALSELADHALGDD